MLADTTQAFLLSGTPIGVASYKTPQSSGGRMRRREFLVRSATTAGSSLALVEIHPQRPRRTDSPHEILRLRHGHARQHRHQNQPPRHGHRHRRLRTSFAPDRARRQRSLRSPAQRIRPRPPLLRRRRFLWKPSACRRSAEARAARQSHRAHQNLGARCRRHARRSRPLPPRTRHRLPRHLPDALRHRSRLDRPLQRRDGRALRSQAEGNHPRPRLLLPLDRSPARGRESPLGRNRSGPHQPRRRATWTPIPQRW